MLSSQMYFGKKYIQYKNAYWKRNTHAKDKDFIFLDRENVGEAT